ncbi:hypothetical protein [Asticcacaulis sp. AC402]|uniref:hypothetical protein n=1 Tax=Asticcacaulis sp. AC402 TaxID=1282361 RepID=UPI0003C3C47E|nr:hypothetical protein [Asticcacaulis sp. AC402]ESQ77214.1 hypothetical protein ABAC402_02085 [Asticcacaulis sp. AC402]
MAGMGKRFDWDRLVWLNFAGLLLAGTCLVTRAAVWSVAACALAPVVACGLVLASRRELTLDPDDPMRRTTLYYLATLPGCALGAATAAYNLIDWLMPLLAACFVALALTLWSWSKRPLQVRAVGFIILGSVPYVYAVLVHGNALLDKRGRVESVVVSAKKTSGRYATPYFMLSAWSLKPESDWQKVNIDLYDNVQIDDRVCIISHPGGLGFRWYEVRICESHPAAT